ncbi:ELKS/Rab6-interacting/CAST family member 1, partial [Armadillidium nasatum]
MFSTSANFIPFSLNLFLLTYILPYCNKIHFHLFKKPDKLLETKSTEILPPRLHTRSHSQPLLQQQEIRLLELEGKEREYHLHLDQLHVDIKLKEAIIENLTEDGSRYRERIEELEEEIKNLEEEIKQGEKIEELEELVVVVKQKNERIEELEEALRQSVRIAADLEMEKKDEEERRREITGKLEELEERMENAKISQSVKCPTCCPLRNQLEEVEKRLQSLLLERKQHLEELFDLKHEALTSALSEKDAHIALLEMSGAKTARTAQEISNLAAERTRLNERIKKQSEERVKLLQNFSKI